MAYEYGSAEWAAERIASMYQQQGIAVPQDLTQYASAPAPAPAPVAAPAQAPQNAAAPAADPNAQWRTNVSNWLSQNWNDPNQLAQAVKNGQLSVADVASVTGKSTAELQQYLAQSPIYQQQQAAGGATPAAGNAGPTVASMNFDPYNPNAMVQDPKTGKVYQAVYSGTGGQDGWGNITGYLEYDGMPTHDEVGKKYRQLDAQGNEITSGETRKVDHTKAFLTALAGAGAIFGVGTLINGITGFGSAAGAGAAGAGGAGGAGTTGTGVFNAAVDSQLANVALGDSALGGYAAAGAGGVTASPIGAAGGLGAAGGAASGLGGLGGAGGAAGTAGSALSGLAGAGGAAGTAGSVLGTLGSLAGPAAGLAGGLISANAAGKAADQQGEATDKALALYEKMFGKQTELNEPFRIAGVNGAKRLQELLGIGGDATVGDYGSAAKDFSMADYQADPGYAFRLAEGNKALERSASARAGLLSGRAIKDTIAYAQGQASQEYGSAYNRYQTNRAAKLNPLQSIMGAGQSAANTISGAAGQMGANGGSAITGAGNAAAAGTVGSANAISNGLQQGVTMYQQNELMKKLLGSYA